MKQRIKDLIIIYVGLAIYAFLLCLLLGILSGCTAQTFQSSYTEKTPIVYDTPIQNPAKNVTVVEQLPEFVSGDEFASAACLLNAYGYDINIYGLLNSMNYSNTDFYESYVGDARLETGYCYAPALVVCINRAIQHDSNLRAQNYTGLDYDLLAEDIKDNKPYIIWLTDNYAAPNYVDVYCDRNIQLYDNSQAMVVYKIDGGQVYLADSIQGYTTMPEDDFRTLWEQCGSQAIGLHFTIS